MKISTIMKKKRLGVLIAEDSLSLREILIEAINNDDELYVKAVATTGKEAIEQAAATNPDIITMDLIMPEMGGIEAIRHIMASNPTPIVVITSVSDGDTSFEAIRAGALEVVEKPADVSSERGQDKIARMLKTLKSMSEIKVTNYRHKRSTPTNPLPIISAPPILKKPHGKPKVIAIAASTGGPPALQYILKKLPRTFPVPILVVQHITPGFCEGLVKWLDSVMDISVTIATENSRPQAGTVYFAPDDHHLMLNVNGYFNLSKASPIKGFRPSADLLFESVGQYCRNQALGIILTGMGNDGTDGLITLNQLGGYCLAQDPDRAAIYSMPKSAIDAGVVNQVLSLEEIASYLFNISLMTF